MLKQNLIPLTDKKSWDDALRNLIHGPCHLWSYNAALAMSSDTPIFLYVAGDQHYQAACPISVRSKFSTQDIVTPYGFGGLIINGNTDGAIKNLKNFFSSNNYICGYISVNPFLNLNPLENAEEIVSGSPIYVLDLEQDLDSMLTNAAKVHRYEIRQWEKTQHNIITDKKKLSEALPALYTDTLSRVDASAVYHFFTETLTSLLNLDECIALGIEENGNIIAVTITLHSMFCADYFINASSVNGRQYTRGLLWETIKELKSRSIRNFNLGGGIRPNDSLDDFKRRFGGRKIIPKVIKQIYNQPTYNELCQKLGLEANNINYFPAYHSKAHN
jgi:uncharacterized protein YuzE